MEGVLCCCNEMSASVMKGVLEMTGVLVWKRGHMTCMLPEAEPRNGARKVQEGARKVLGRC